MKLFKDNYKENYFKKSSNNKITYYSSNVPDRYSENIHIYNQQTNFLDFSDLEKPITESLKYFYPKLKKGGFLIMHDYSSLYWKGSKNAIDTFFMDKEEMIVPIADKSGSCVIRKI